MTKTETLETGKNANGCTVRLQKRGSKFDVVFCTGFCWKYVYVGNGRNAKGVSEAEARNVFFLETLTLAA